MYELIQAGERTWYVECPAKIGIYDLGGGEVCIIDSGNDKDAGKKVRQILDAHGWKLRSIYNTHAHVDHIGGNNYLQGLTGCAVYVPPLEQFFAQCPDIGTSILTGGEVPAELHNKFFIAKGCDALPLTQDVLPEGLEAVPLPGHSHGMVGFRTCDDVLFLADSLVSDATLTKYQVSFIFDVGTYLKTLENVKTLTASLFVPSHAEACTDIVPLAQRNLDKCAEIAGRIAEFCRTPMTFEEVLAAVFSAFSLRMSLQQYVLVGCTIRSYLCYLKEAGRLETIFEADRMLWHTL